MVGVGLAGAALIVFVPRRSRWLLVGVIGLAFVVTGTRRKVAGPAAGNDRPSADPTWIEEATGGSAPVTVLFVDPSRCSTPDATKERWIAFWRAAFFNPVVTDPVSIGTPLPDSTGAECPCPRAAARSSRATAARSRPPTSCVDTRLPLRRAVRVAPEPLPAPGPLARRRRREPGRAVGAARASSSVCGVRAS